MKDTTSVKRKADSEIRYQISKTLAVLAAVSMSYSYLGNRFSYNSDLGLRRRVDSELGSLKSALLSLIALRSIKLSQISAYNNQEKYGISREMSIDEARSLLLEEIDGDTADGRMDKYISQLKDESEKYMVAGIVAGLSYQKVANIFAANIRKPLIASLITSTLGADKSEYGKGNYASAFSNMLRLDYDMSQRAYMRNEWLTFMLSKKVAGYLVYRNSSIPCEICDQYAGKVYPMSAMILPIHPRCICGAIPVLVDGKELEKEPI